MAGRDVVLLLTDRERADLTRPDGPAVETPAADRLRREGTTFERAYTPTDCRPAAVASLRSGLYPHDHGVLDATADSDPPGLDDAATYPSLAADSGYALADCGGVRDLPLSGDGSGDGTDAPEGSAGEADATGGSVPPTFEAYRRDLGVDPGETERTDRITAGPDGRLVAATTELPPAATRAYYVAERAIDRLEALADGDAPFLLRVAFPTLGPPYVVPEPYASTYDPAEVPLWDTLRETFAGKPTVQERAHGRSGAAALAEDDWRTVVARYFGLVTFVDRQRARVLDAVDRLDRDPVVVATAARGAFVGSHRQLDGGPLMYEDAYRVPLWVRWPGETDPGSTRDAFVRLQDLMPTICAVCGVDPPSGVDGRSLVGLLAGSRPADWPDSVFCEYHGDAYGRYSQRMVRTDRYKYVYDPGGREELYDLRTDPGELQNLAGNPLYDEVAARLRRELYGWMVETGDAIEGRSRAVLLDR
ncbi:sulfatase/phosphatase domain-containing protein [Halosimplex marinum]|uniref:sulfatase/phosphatase domain-containing protein n=1 Tax=Halosimplex marinum TaxID=3396620 RepID=UPI003F565698